MIKLTRFNGSEIWINPHQIEFIEETPDTIVKMFSERKVFVKETAAQVTAAIVEYRRRLGVAGNETVF